MFSTNIVMIQATSFIDCQLNHFFGAWSEADLTEDYAVSTANYKFDRAANLIQFNAEVTQYFCSNTLTFAHNAEEKMFCTNIIVLEALSFFFSEAQNFASSLCKLIKPISIIHLFVTPLSVAEGGTEPSVSLR